jgi:hypothetical protein
MEKLICKNTNELEEFKKEKIINSLVKIGFSLNNAQEIYEKLKDKFNEAKTTQQIFNIILDYLKKFHPDIAPKYNLKNAIFRFGPAGFLFEKYFSKVLQSYGYETLNNQIIEGKCVSHEIDIIAKKEDEIYIIECKFHKEKYFKTDVKDILVFWSRFLDIKENSKEKIFPWLVTNTKVTLEVLKFAFCKNIKVTSWNSPLNESLFSLIEHYGIWPITILTTLKDEKLKIFLEKGIVLLSEIFDIKKEELISILGKDYDLVMNEVKTILNLTFSK